MKRDPIPGEVGASVASRPDVLLRCRPTVGTGEQHEEDQDDGDLENGVDEDALDEDDLDTDRIVGTESPAAVLQTYNLGYASLGGPIGSPS